MHTKLVFSTSQSSSWPDLVSPYSKLWFIKLILRGSPVLLSTDAALCCLQLIWFTICVKIPSSLRAVFINLQPSLIWVHWDGITWGTKYIWTLVSAGFNLVWLFASKQWVPAVTALLSGNCLHPLFAAVQNKEENKFLSKSLVTYLEHTDEYRTLAIEPAPNQTKPNQINLPAPVNSS